MKNNTKLRTQKIVLNLIHGNCIYNRKHKERSKQLTLTIYDRFLILSPTIMSSRLYNNYLVVGKQPPKM